MLAPVYNSVAQNEEAFNELIEYYDSKIVDYSWRDKPEMVNHYKNKRDNLKKLREQALRTKAS